ncbi:GntR family transcriptional regulator [Nocardia sp. NPDC088792]|uniref:GntR family transcriptional regulator n=1 Tax=Nocardia sp. NPDC088792 TaxID=3364332 RepID=UPI003825ADBA
MATKSASASRTEEIFEQLRADVLNGRYVPGQRMKSAELAERFQVSLTVIREALTRLAEQDLLVANPQRGFSVRTLSIADLEDLTSVRIQFETAALRQSFERGDLAWETTVLGAHHTLERTPVVLPDGSFNETWPTIHRDFHRALLAGCGSPRLEAITISLRDSAELYRRWYYAMTDDHDRDIPQEHRDLKDFALARDIDAAIPLLSEHIERAPRRLIAYAAEHGLDTMPVQS